MSKDSQIDNKKAREEKQNENHNSKKEGLGQNTKR